MPDFDDDIKEILNRDPKAEVEEGLHKQHDPFFMEKPPPPDALDDRDIFASSLSFTPEEYLAHAAKINALKDAAMFLTGDSSFSNEVTQYLNIAKSIGFKIVLDLPFETKDAFDETPRKERFFILWRTDGILLVFDTFGGNSVNGGHFYYNWVPNEGAHDVTSSGGMINDKTWAGDHDCRQGLKFHIRQLEKNGKFLPKWEGRPWLWLLHHGDTSTNNFNREKITAERIAMLPPEVQEAIGKE